VATANIRIFSKDTNLFSRIEKIRIFAVEGGFLIMAVMCK